MATTSSKSNTKSKSTHPISDKMQDTLHESVDTLAEKAASTEERVRDAAHAGSENFAAKKEEMQSAWDQSSIKKYASENPVAAAGIAFAAGVLLTSLLRRK